MYIKVCTYAYIPTQRYMGAVAVGQLVECLSNMFKALGSNPPHDKLGVVTHSHSPSTSVGQAEG